MGLNTRYRKCMSVLVVVAMLVLAVPAVAAAEVKPAVVGGTIQGTVTDAATGLPITWDSTSQTGTPVNVEVWYDAGGGSWDQVTDMWGNPLATTADDGTYLIQDLSPGTYYLRFVDFWGTGYRTEFYNDAFDVTDATPVVVTAGSTLTRDIALDLIEWGGAAGTITDATSHALVSDVYAEFYEPDGFGNWNWTWGAVSLSLGDWTVQAPAGSYKIRFLDPYGRFLLQWYGGGTDMAASPLVTVAPTHTTPGIDADMVRCSHITGRVTDGGGNPIEGVYAQAFTPDGNEVAEGAHQLPTDADGYYDYGWLPAGTYRIVFWDDQGRYVQEAWNNHPAAGKYIWEAATLGDDIVVPAATTVTGKDAVLAAAGVITGTVTDAMGPVPWAKVTALDAATGGWVADSYTDETGFFSVGGLPTGDYKVQYSLDMGMGADWYYMPLYYLNVGTLGGATPIHVTAGATSSGANGYLPMTGNWGVIQGTVTDAATGAKMQGMEVARWVSDGAGGWIQEDVTQTDKDGFYRFRYAPNGSAKVTASDPWLLDYGKMYADQAWTVAVGGGLYTHDFSMARATVDEWGSPLQSGIISGYVVKGDAPGTYVPYAPVEFYQYDSFSGEYWYGGVNSADATGKYVGVVPVGTYRVKAGPTLDYAARYFPAAETVVAGTDIVVTDGAVLTGKNITLPRGNKISGHVTDHHGAGLPGVEVMALQYDSAWDVWEPVSWDGSTTALTDAAGNYTLGGLGAGPYKVAFYGWKWDFGAKWWKSTGSGAQSVDQAEQITFATTPSVRSGVNASLSPSVVIRGTVTDEDSVRVSGMKVKLWWDDPAGSWSLIQSTYAYHDGDFQFGQFSAGDYYLEFVHDTAMYDTNWYKNAATQALATPVTLADGESIVVTQTVQSNDTTYSPVFGASRIETAIKASETAFPEGASTVVIATGYNWPDALGGAALAGAYSGPILLTDPSYLPWQVMDEVVRLGATDAIILGGTGAVRTSVESALKAELGQLHVRRLAGDNRYETATMVAQETVDRLGAAYDGTAFVATGENFPDALGASPLAAAACWPIYLTPGDSLNPLTSAAMADHGVTKALILGETGAISDPVADAIDAIPGVASVVRLGGSSRYQTAVKVAQYGVDNVYGLGWNNVAVATGQNYPDALAGGVLQGLGGSVMLLTPTNALDANVAAKLTEKKAVITEVRYLGGLNAVSTPVRTAIANLLN